jgi:hypothetical protein
MGLRIQNTNDNRWHLMAYDLETGKHSLDLPDIYLKGHADVDGDGVDELFVQKCNGRPVGTNGEIGYDPRIVKPTSFSPSLRWDWI